MDEALRAASTLALELSLLGQESREDLGVRHRAGDKHQLEHGDCGRVRSDSELRK